MEYELDEFVIYMRSDDSQSFFPNNTAFSFSVQLPHTIAFTGMWKCCLDEISYPAVENLANKTLTLHCDFVDHSVIDGNSFQVLRRFFHRNFTGHVFGDNRYIPVLKTSARQLTFWITRDNTNEIIEGQGVTYLTLKFRRHIKWM
jgi:hypothetical protein